MKKNKVKMNLQLFATTPIFDMVTAPETAAYWETRQQFQQPYLGAELFPDDKQLGTTIKWAKGSTGAPKFLKPSGLDAKAIPRGRKEFDQVLTKLGFFKESLYVDEELRQQLNNVVASGNKVMIDTIMNKIFADNVELVSGAAVTREILRMQLLMTGKAKVEGNGQLYELDYEMKTENQVHAKVSWSDAKNSDPFKDIQDLMDKIQLDTGERPSRAVTNLTTFNQIAANEKINKAISVFGGGNVIVTNEDIIDFFKRKLKLTIAVYDQMYEDENGANQKFVPDNKFSLLPAGSLGTTAFATTPEESDLMAGSNRSEVAIVDTGVAITTMKIDDPVQVETKVTMLSLPTFEQINKVGIIDTVAKP